MLILALDTSGDTGSMALLDGDTVRMEENFHFERRLGELLPDFIKQMLGRQEVTIQQVDAFAVGLGPGSFTSVRVGVTLAKTWAFALQKPLVGISSLDALARAGVREERGEFPPKLLPEGSPVPAVVAAVPTRRTEAVAAFYAPGSTTPVAPPVVVPHADIVGQGRSVLGLSEDAPVLLVGDAAWTVQEATKEQARLFVWKTHPFASDVALLASRRLASGEQDDPFTLAPLYVTPPPVRGPDGNFRTDIGPV